MKLMRAALRLLSRLAPDAAARVAANLFMTPQRHATPPRERDALTGAEAFDVSAGDETTLKAWRFGAGPTVLLVHGWEGRGSQLAPFVQPLVAAGYSVVTFDAPGHGASDGKRSSLPHVAWAVRCVAAAVGEVHGIIAHSLGAAAATLALRDGLRVQRLVFVAPPAEPVTYVRRFGQFLGLPESMIDRVQARIEERFLRAWADYSLVATAPAMTAPLLVVHDREDVETTWEEGAAIVAAWPGARMMTTTGLGHRRILRDAAVIAATTEFVNVRRWRDGEDAARPAGGTPAFR